MAQKIGTKNWYQKPAPEITQVNINSITLQCSNHARVSVGLVQLTLSSIFDTHQ